jgi:hypothetical protein
MVKISDSPQLFHPWVTWSRIKALHRASDWPSLGSTGPDRHRRVQAFSPVLVEGQGSPKFIFPRGGHEMRRADFLISY